MTQSHRILEVFRTQLQQLILIFFRQGVEGSVQLSIRGGSRFSSELGDDRHPEAPLDDEIALHAGHVTGVGQYRQQVGIATGFHHLLQFGLRNSSE